VAPLARDHVYISGEFWNKRRVVLLYGSMYRRTKHIAEPLAEKLGASGFLVSVFNASVTHPTY